MQQDESDQVIIVGAGPVGLTLANLLGLHGVQTLVLEKDPLTPDAPRAVSLDDESLRIWQQCGLLSEMRPFIAEGDEGDVVFTYRTRSGKPLFSMTQHGRPYGYARGNVFLFHRILDVLRTGLERFPHVELRSGWAVQGCVPKQESVCLIAVDDRGRRHQLETPYLAGCDGGRSTIRNQLDITLQGSVYSESWLIVDTFDPGLVEQPLMEGVEVWCDKRCPTASIPLPGGYQRWEFLLRKGSPLQDNSSDEQILRLIEQRKAPGGARVIRRLVHTYKASVAERYRQGRVFLAGDAAHLSPPFAGQGMATGLRDAANLAWKLAHVLHGEAASELLDSYELERRPHQVRMLRLARRMGLMMMPSMQIHERLVELLFGFAGRFSWLRHAMEIRGVNITPVYPSERSSDHKSKAGHLLIQPKIGKDQLLDDLLGLNYSVITFDRAASELTSNPEVDVWRRQGTSFVNLRPDGVTGEAFQAFQEWLGDCRQHLLIVRPDRFVLEDRSLNRFSPPDNA